MLEIKDLAVHFGDRTLFDKTNLLLYPGHRYGLVGANGAGKSTLMKILEGSVTEFQGELNWPSHTRIGVLQQDHFLFEDQSLVDTVMQGRQELWRALKIQQELSSKTAFSPADTEAFASAQVVIDKEHGYAAESEAARLLNGLGLLVGQHQQPLKTLSGGYKLRVLMAQLLFSQPDILLLDEPTNHLDLYAIRWLGEYLTRFPGLLMVISHDREFLDEVCTDTLDIDYGIIKLYTGNYEQFLITKAQDKEQKEKELERQEKTREHAEQFINRFRAKATKAAAVQSRVKMLEKMDEVELQASSRRHPHFRFPVAQRSGEITLSVKHVSKSFGDKQVLNNVTFEVQRGDRIALIGPNGIGKSTLLKIIIGELKVSEGKTKWGHEAAPGYFPQDYHEVLPEQETLYRWLAGQADAQPESNIRALLGRALFVGNEVQHKIMTLSGGESSRLIFASLMLKEPNVLLLDEPTNHLDMEAIDSLAAALHDYKGTLMCVSHNRYFVRAIANRILELTPEGFTDFRGSYAEYLEGQGTDHLDRSQTKTANGKPLSEGKRQNQQDYESQKATQRKLRNLERKIPDAEQHCQDLEHLCAANQDLLAEAYLSGSEAQQQASLHKQQELEAQLEQAYSDWEAFEMEYADLLES